MGTFAPHWAMIYWSNRNDMSTVKLPPSSSRQPAPMSTEEAILTKRPAQTPAAKKKRKWPWTLINFWLDSLLLVNFLALIWVSTVIRFVFPTASISAGWTLWGFSLDAFLGLQFTLMAVFAFGIVLHLMLHWSWVCGVLFGKILPKKEGAALPDDGTRTIYGVGLMIVILNVLGIFIAAAALSIQSPL